MEEVREFYLRNSDGTFNLQPVITPTVTIDYDKYDQSRQINFDSLQFDATNELIGSIENVYGAADILGGHIPMPFTKLPAKAGNGILMGPRLREF